MNARQTLALLTALSLTAPLAGCDLIDILLDQPTKAQRDHDANQARIALSLPEDRTPDFSDLPGYTPPAEPEVVAEVPPPPVVVEPPAPVYEYDRYNADPAGYQCQAVFRSLSCLDDGRPVYLGSQMEQLPFGTHP